jgi:hypothetical protein
MTDKTKKRARDRMQRTGETYQSALNQNRRAGGLAIATPQTPTFEIPCDICGRDLLPTPGFGMIQWLYETEEIGDRRVSAVFFCHKFRCDTFVRELGRKNGLHDSWEELYPLIGKDWFPAARSLLGYKEFNEDHEERLNDLFVQISSMRERGWRPARQREEAGRDRRAEIAAEEAAQLEAMQKRDLNDIVKLFAPESAFRKRHEAAATLRKLHSTLEKPEAWVDVLEDFPDIEAHIAANDFAPGTFGAWLKEARMSRNPKPKPE